MQEIKTAINNLISVGDRVCYEPAHYNGEKWENGIVKEIPDGFENEKSLCHKCLRVVYNCNGDWENFKNYTSALTHISSLKLGWRFE